MKSNHFLIAGATLLSLLAGSQLTASAKVTTTVTYQAKTKTTTLYKSLPTSKKSKGTNNYKLSGSFKLESTAKTRGIKYALLTQNGKKVGWVRLSSLYKVTTKTTTTDKVKKTPSSTSKSSDGTTASSTPTTSTSTGTTTQQNTANTTTNTDPNASTAIANMDYSRSATNNPSSTVQSLMNQTNVDWNDSNTLSAIAQSALNQVNSARTAAGLPALTINDQLTKIAQLRAQQISSNFDHWDASGQLIAYDDAQQLGLDVSSHSSSLSENLGKSFYTDGDTPNTVSNKIIGAFQAEGPENGDGQEHGHYVNDMDSSNKQVGISVYSVAGSNDIYLAMEFGNYYK
ncbi:CAP domain-containing protein [Lactobacillus sp. Sy-1]|uniref:CAP domain-containing protein n=1 Tax=Lactobacillus sp. Sy-1 TaxID=2109645 RepID=UPI001C58994F|nr:CAP domain-containing protein [Lactobacillus sp. Sy-1]MBW1605068.1 CAP domain-containing protein [Lactobacillus sp. Sy-1]